MTRPVAAIPSTTCYTPRQLEAAYGILPLLEHGTDGRGETVVLPELAEPQFPLPASDIRRDLAQFDKLFHLPAARVRVVSTLAPSASPWLANGEEVLDTEMVHAIAPAAAIVEVLVKGTSLTTPPMGWQPPCLPCGSGHRSEVSSRSAPPAKPEASTATLVPRWPPSTRP